MRAPSARLLAWAIFTACAVAPPGLVGCSDRGHAQQPAQGNAGKADALPIQFYTVRGRIERLPDPKDPTIGIRHEPITGFMDTNGATQTMPPMTMPFPLARGLSVEGYAVGDQVRFAMMVNWRSAQPIVLVKVEKLPPETRLDLGE